jgi:hypothetical protein
MNTVFSSIKPVMRPAALVCALLFSAGAAAFDSGSTGALGALNVTVNQEIELPADGILNYTTVNIPAGVTVTFKKNAANTPVHILASGNVTLAGTISLKGGDAKATGTYGDGDLGDDGLPGLGGPGGYDGGRGGRNDEAQRPEVVRGGAGLGPGGGAGGIEGANGCGANRYVKYVGTGGAYASNTYPYYATYYSSCSAQPLGKAYGSAVLQPLIGGSGGGGGRGGTIHPGSGGGGGAGALLIATSGTLSVTGTINAIGGDGGGIAGPGVGGQGAGGSGGAIRLVATTLTGNGKLYANGGCINLNGSSRQRCGWSGGDNQYGGSPGRIRLEAEALTFNGTSDPAYSFDQPGPVFIAGAPSLRIASIGGEAVPANPTGHADLIFPAATTDPVNVVFETVNVPVGNIVNLRIVPAYGNTTEVVSPAISGSDASGSASVSVVLPAGPSTLQATTTYTVVIAGDLDLSRFAMNERVEKVEVTVALAGEPTARVLTASGKAYDVPFAELRAAGFAG